MLRVRVRGIYSTALTKLLLESQFQLVQPSAVREERFEVGEEREPYDLGVEDRPDRQGAHITGRIRAVDKIYSLLRKRLPDVVLRRRRVAVDGVYKGLITRVDEEGGGVYDGMGAPKEEGDYAVTDATIGEWHLKTRYFSKKERLKGTYVNLNTPIELYPRTLRYLDLEVDITIQPDGKVTVLDAEKLEEKVEEGYLTRDLTKKVQTELKNLLDELEK